MVNFGRRLSEKTVEKQVNPIDIYGTLDRSTDTGPLRPAQEHILSEWFAHKQKDKNVIVKLHTGEGKTLIGLLMLYSKLNQNEGPCLYVCPDKYLVAQVAKEADKFGIPFCVMDSTEIPNDFLSGKKILGITIQKLFNGKTIFKLDTQSIVVGSLVLDDAHACIDSIKRAFTIRIGRESDLYPKLLELFETDLISQGEGSYLDIKNGRRIEEVMAVPYWSWISKKSELTSLLAENSECNEVKFVWPLLRNCIEDCQMFATNNGIEISPYMPRIDRFGSFDRAKQRILMSATTQDDSFFIRGFNFDVPSVEHPLRDVVQKWSGEKMILIPSLIDDILQREAIIPLLINKPLTTFGIVAIVPAFRFFDDYGYPGVHLAKRETIIGIIEQLKLRNFDYPVIFANRYDGIDLPDAACRILLLDSVPVSDNLSDRYEEQCRINSDIINIKRTQKIEQGLGRSVRGEKDYSVIILIGPDLVRFVKSIATNKYFSAQTKKQIELGLEIAGMAKEDIGAGEAPEKTLVSLINQCLSRDDAWKQFYKREMDKISNNNDKNFIYEILSAERDAEYRHLQGENDKACEFIQKLINSGKIDDSEKGWYLQIMARYKYAENRVDSGNVQLSAFKNNNQLLKPNEGVNYKKIGYINENRISRIKTFISQFESYEELMLSVEDTLSNLSFGMSSDKFEKAIYDIGVLLGFLSQRPDKEIRKGPDNLWCGIDNQYILFECKDEVDGERADIHKHEAGQMNNHCGWFEEEYPNCRVKYIMIISTLYLAYNANFTHKVEIMRKNKLNLLKGNIAAFVKSLKKYHLKDLANEVIQESLIMHKLDIVDFVSDQYTEPYKKRTKQ